MPENLLYEIADFLWTVLRDPIYAALAVGAVFVAVIVIATWFNHFDYEE